jgi:GTP pyrophosphokinase
VPLRRTATRQGVTEVDEETRLKLIRIDGKRGADVKFARCCNPMPGHTVQAYETQLGLSVHRADCKNFLKSEPDPGRLHSASWEGDVQYKRTLRVTIGARPNSLTDLTSAMRPINVDIIDAHFGAAEGASYFEFTFQTQDISQVDRIIRALKTVTGVTRVTRVSEEAPALAKTG